MNRSFGKIFANSRRFLGLCSNRTSNVPIEHSTTSDSIGNWYVNFNDGQAERNFLTLNQNLDENLGNLFKKLTNFALLDEPPLIHENYW